MSKVTNSTRLVSINRPHGDPRHYKMKGRPMLMEDGSVNVTCKEIGRGSTCYISLSADAIRELVAALDGAVPPKTDLEARPISVNDRRELGRRLERMQVTLPPTPWDA